MVVGVSLNEPLFEGVELFWLVAAVGGETLAGEGVVLLTLVLALLEVNNLKIVWVGGVVGD